MSRTLAGSASSSALTTTSSISLPTSSVTSSGHYVKGYAQARTPNPVHHLQYAISSSAVFFQRGSLLGFDAIATGHHARVTKSGTSWQLRRGRDVAKEPSYVLYMLGQAELAGCYYPSGN